MELEESVLESNKCSDQLSEIIKAVKCRLDEYEKADIRLERLAEDMCTRV